MWAFGIMRPPSASALFHSLSPVIRDSVAKFTAPDLARALFGIGSVSACARGVSAVFVVQL